MSDLLKEKTNIEAYFKKNRKHNDSQTRNDLIQRMVENYKINQNQTRQSIEINDISKTENKNYSLEDRLCQALFGTSKNEKKIKK